MAQQVRCLAQLANGRQASVHTVMDIPVSQPQAGQVDGKHQHPITGLPGPAQLMRHDFLLAIGNPKAIAIFTAFFPQFVDFTAPLSGQFALLGGLFLTLELLAVALYAGLGRVLQSLLTPPRLHRLNRGVGGFLITSGLTMALNPRH